MQTTTIDVPSEILLLLQGTDLGSRSPGEQVTITLAIHLFLQGVVSIGKAAELAQQPRVDFEWLLSQMGLPLVTYDVADYEQDMLAISHADHQPPR